MNRMYISCDSSSSTLLEEDLYLSSDEEVIVPESQVRSQRRIPEKLTCIRETDIVDKNLNIRTNSLNSFPLQAKEQSELSRVVAGISNRQRTPGEFFF